MGSDLLRTMVDLGSEYKRKSAKPQRRQRASHAGMFRAGHVFRAHEHNDEFRPLFVSRNLNRCYFQKVVSSRYEGNEIPENTVSTKIILPYEVQHTSRGNGMFMYIGEKNFSSKIERAFNSSMSLVDQEKDFKILEIIDSMPTFDPFLLKDKFETEKFELDPHYAEVTHDDFMFVKSQIMKDFERIVVTTLGPELGLEVDGANNLIISGAAEKLFQALWNLDNLDTLRPLARALGVDDSDAKEYFYSWKGLLFYVHGHSKSYSNLEDELTFIGRYCLSDGRGDVDVINESIKKILKEKMTLDRFFYVYHDAFECAFVRKVETGTFLEILKNARSLFWTIGTIIGRLDIFISYFQGAKSISRSQITPEDMRSFLRNNAN